VTVFDGKGVTMFGRNGARTAVADAAGELSGYGSQLVEDEKLRERLRAALVAGAAARRRARRRAGVRGLAQRLASDPVLRAQLVEMVVQLQAARRRMGTRRSHRVRNSLLVLAGFGAASAAVSVPSVRQRVLGLVGDLKDRGQSVAPGTGPTVVTEEITVDAPLSATYNRWTQFEEFPRFMEGVEEVEQLDDTRLRWVAKVAGKRAEWNAKILSQEPDRKISWQSEDGKETRGTVTFQELGPTRTLVRLEMTYLPQGVLEQAGSAIGLDRRRIRGDLERFKEQSEANGGASGWRGTIEGGQETSAPASP
jgi:uncharacterized membrane protein